MAVTQSVFDPEDLRRLNLTQHIREQVIGQLMPEGKFPEDKDGRNSVIKLLDGMDRTSLTKTRLRSDDAANQNQEATLDVIAKLLARTSAVAKPDQLSRKEAPALEGEFAHIETVPGEMAGGDASLNYDTFINS